MFSPTWKRYRPSSIPEARMLKTPKKKRKEKEREKKKIKISYDTKIHTEKSVYETYLLTISGETFDDQQQRQQRFAIIVMLLQERVEHFNGIKYLYF